MWMQPVIYTRPYKAETMDYCFFVLPEIFKSEKVAIEPVRESLRNVMGVEGFRGNIRERRWHVLRFDQYVLVGIATEEFKRYDELKRPIRGYYGIVYKKNDTILPKASLFGQLDEFYVEPKFNSEKRFEPEFISDVGARIVKELYLREESPEINSLNLYDFNTDEHKLQYLPFPGDECEITAMLADALKCARIHERFEFVYGLNSIRHCQEHPIMNVCCYECPERKIEEIPLKMPARQTLNPVATPRPTDVRVKTGQVFESQPKSKPFSNISESHDRQAKRTSLASDVRTIVVSGSSRIIEYIVYILKLIPGVELQTLTYSEGLQDNQGKVNQASKRVSGRETESQQPDYTMGLKTKK